MAPPSFNSSQTAVAIILPTHLQTEIDLIRSLNDKAYGRWQPHINLLYPFVNLGLLPSARNTLGEAVRHNQLETFKIRIDDVGVFKHRKNATVYLKPSTESEDSLRRLRRILVSHLGGDDPGEHAQLEGTEYHPHLTIGQADLAGDAIEELSMKARKLVGVEWECKSLGLLRREPSGQMTLDFDLQLLNQKAGHDCSGLEHAESDREGDTSPAEHGWTSCFSFNPESGWSQPLKYTSAAGNGRTDTSLTISSYNLMADPSAPQLSERFPLIMDALCSTKLSAESSLRILCLQEVNDETLTLLLSNSDIQATYPYSTHSPSSVFPSHRNLLTLASVPFKQFTIAFPQRHKTALVIQPVNSTVSVINVHLTSALTDEAIISKQVQMTQLTNFITRDKALGGREVFVVGDFNVTTSCRTLEAALDKGIISHETAQSVESVIDMDFWGDAYIESGHHLEESRDDLHPGEEGATFDRSSNPLAAMSKTVIDTSPQRYDRILFRKGAQIDVKLFERFGFPTSTGQCGSDHFGIHARLALGQPQVSASDIKSMTTATSEFQLNKIELIEDATDVSCLIEPYLPSPEDRNQRTAALDIIHKALVTDDALADLVIAPLGSYAMDTYLANSDLDLLAIGSVAPRQFFESAISRMRALANADSNNDGFKSVQIVNSLVQIIDVIVAGVKVDLQYCQAAELLQRYHSSSPVLDLRHLVFDPAAISGLPPWSLRPLNTFRDTAYLLNTMPEISSYRTAHRFIAIYLKRRGLYSAKFGYLGGIHLSLMLNRLVKLLVASKNDEDTSLLSPASIIRSFFYYYSGFDWASDVVADPTLPTPGSSSRSKRSLREPVFIRSIHTPTARINVAASCNRLSAQTITSEFTLARDMLALGHWDWCLRPARESICDFFDKHGAFVRVKINMWDIDEVGADTVRDTMGNLESKIPGLMVGLGKSEWIQGRAWPQRFRVPDSDDGVDNGRLGYYLVGVSAKQEYPEDDPDNDTKKLLEGKVVIAAREFERVIRDSKRFDGTHAWIDAEVVSKKKVYDMGLVIDTRDWSAEAAAMASAAEATTSTSATQHVESSSKGKDSKTLSASVPRTKSSNKLRPVQDIISRIKWDPDLSADDFIIGYEDRFAGVMEIDLLNWKTDQTHLEFIPAHRIVWIRRKGDDGERVWDRRARFDALFGSGIRRAVV